VDTNLLDNFGYHFMPPLNYRNIFFYNLFLKKFIPHKDIFQIAYIISVIILGM